MKDSFFKSFELSVKYVQCEPFSMPSCDFGTLKANKLVALTRKWRRLLGMLTWEWEFIYDHDHD